ncbi:hypothetical protein NEDG_01362 [Nematocida displodere]|uniref:Uncharacterized protein n=1 Tax=Nematocida displodere TaxID=1805483 RepID=A0A177EE73_9MICR|nr:hypothetical protein NEDG_01362 [Nematocida displodere]
MDAFRRQGIALLEEILACVEEILTFSRVSPATTEKDIHKEIREAFIMKTKTEALASSLVMMHSILLDIDTLADEGKRWKRVVHPSPLKKQNQKNRELLLNFLSQAINNPN